MTRQEIIERKLKILNTREQSHFDAIDNIKNESYENRNFTNGINDRDVRGGFRPEHNNYPDLYCQ